MSTKEVYDYVMHTPRNTNPAVLSSMLGHLSWNDLKDKPFYSEVKEEVILEQQSFTFYDDANEGGYMFRLPHPLNFPSGASKAVVFFDGQEYSATVIDESNGWYYIVGEDLPFFITSSEEGGWTIIKADQGTHEIGITYTNETVHKLDAKYLPSTIPKKLSDLENDLWYSKKERFLTLTKADFVPWNNPDEFTEYLYTASPKLEWLTSANAIAWELSVTGADGQSMIFTQDDMPMRLEDDYTDDGGKFANYFGDAPFCILSGADYKNWDAPLSKDEFTVSVSPDMYDTVDAMILKIYRVDEKKIPIEYCDTSEIEDEIYSLADEVANL